jgi:hypothetical protein
MAGSNNGYGMYIFFNMAWPKFQHQHSRNQTLFAIALVRKSSTKKLINLR